MTSTKRPLQLSLDDINSIDKDISLSSYKLRSHSKIGSGFLDTNNNFRGASLIFDNSEEEHSQEKQNTPSPTSPMIKTRKIENNFQNKINFLSDKTSWKEKSWQKELDTNELFENFDELVHVKFASQRKLQALDNNQEFKSITKDLNFELSIESERDYWAVAGIKPPQENSIQIHNQRSEFSQRKFSPLQPLQDFVPGSSFIDDIDTRLEYRIKGSVEIDSTHSRNKLKQAIPNQKSSYKEKEKKWSHNDKENFHPNKENNQIGKQNHNKESTSQIQTQLKIQTEQESSSFLKDWNNIRSSEKKMTTNEENNSEKSCETQRLHFRLSQGQDSVLKNDKNFPEAPKHAESGSKTRGFSSKKDSGLFMNRLRSSLEDY